MGVKLTVTEFLSQVKITPIWELTPTTGVKLTPVAGVNLTPVAGVNLTPMVGVNLTPMVGVKLTPMAGVNLTIQRFKINYTYFYCHRIALAQTLQ